MRKIPEFVTLFGNSILRLRRKLMTEFTMASQITYPGRTSVSLQIIFKGWCLNLSGERTIWLRYSNITKAVCSCCVWMSIYWISGKLFQSRIYWKIWFSKTSFCARLICLIHWSHNQSKYYSFYGSRFEEFAATRFELIPDFLFFSVLFFFFFLRIKFY